MSALSFTYAKYTTQDQASDSARVAKFDITMDGSSGSLDTIDGINDSPSAIYLFSVTSKSEVSATADLTLTVGNDKEMPDCIAVELFDVTELELDGTVSDEALTADINLGLPQTETGTSGGAVSFTFEQFAKFSPTSDTGDTKQFALRFIAGPHGSIKESANINLNLAVTVSQTD